MWRKAPGANCTDVNACEIAPCFPDVECTDMPAPAEGRTCGACPPLFKGNGTVCEVEDDKAFEASIVNAIKALPLDLVAVIGMAQERIGNESSAPYEQLALAHMDIKMNNFTADKFNGKLRAAFTRATASVMEVHEPSAIVTDLKPYVAALSPDPNPEESVPSVDMTFFADGACRTPFDGTPTSATVESGKCVELKKGEDGVVVKVMIADKVYIGVDETCEKAQVNHGRG